ncbi:hypothetical protein LTS18_014668, partial [Coniosporium uncinatum]
DQRRHGQRNRHCISKHPFFRPDSAVVNAQEFTYDDLLDVLSCTPDEDQAEQWSKYYASGPHLAGKNLSQALWTRDRWQEWGVLDTQIVAYDVYVNYPRDHGLRLFEKADVLEEDNTSGLKDRIPTFHGYSASGNVTAPYVFCNYGTYEDYQQMLAANISLEGKIALVKYGRNFRGLKVQRAQELGMVGIVMYSDPGDYGDMTEEKGEKPYPKGPARQPSSVQRGSVQYL